MSDYKCYSCSRVCGQEDLAAECMCYNEGEPHYRGVCKDCKNVAVTEYKSPPDDWRHHNLNKIHEYPLHVSDFWKSVNENCPRWNSLSTSAGMMTFENSSGVVYIVPKPVLSCSCCSF
jgi:hypothetical protein